MTEELRRWAIEQASKNLANGTQVGSLPKLAAEIAAFVDGSSDLPLPDGWLKWNGGKQPVEDARVLDVRFRNGTAVRSVASNWNWEHFNTPHDIVAYRAVQVTPTPDQSVEVKVGPDEIAPEPNGVNEDAEPVPEDGA